MLIQTRVMSSSRTVAVIMDRGPLGDRQIWPPEEYHGHEAAAKWVAREWDLGPLLFKRPNSAGWLWSTDEEDFPGWEPV